MRTHQLRLDGAGYKAITTEIREAPQFYFAEDYHQQYLAKNLFGTGLADRGFAGRDGGGCGLTGAVGHMTRHSHTTAGAHPAR